MTDEPIEATQSDYKAIIVHYAELAETTDSLSPIYVDVQDESTIPINMEGPDTGFDFDAIYAIRQSAINKLVHGQPLTEEEARMMMGG